MNIFLDTTVLYKDPFWKGNFYKELLDIVREQEVNLFVSTIVLKEVERNYGKILDEENTKLIKTKEKIEHYKFETSPITPIDKQKSLDKLNQFYTNLETRETITILDYENDLLPEIVERAVWRRKPFTESKTELKDALTWLTYAKYAEKHQLDNCILLSENVTDFCDTEKLKKEIFEIHPELQKDSNKFKIYLSPKTLIQQEKKTLQSATQRFSAWLKEQNFDEEFLLDIIETNFRNVVERKIERKFENYDLHSIFESDYYLTGYVSLDGFDFTNIDNINVDVFKDECIISGDLHINCEVEGYEYNSVRDSGEDSHRYYGSTDLQIMATFSFTYDKNEVPTNFDIDYISKA